MGTKLASAGLAVALILCVGQALTAADQTPVQAVSWADQPDVVELTVVSKEVIQSKKFEIGANQRGFYINVMQDCWTTDIEELYIDIEMENYILNPDNVVFVWKHKIFEGCTNYLATVVGLPCENGKPPVARRVAWVVPNLEYGFIEPGAEYIFNVTVTGLPEGTWDWFVVTECHDTNGMITPPLKDGDIDDVIGANLGVVSMMPVVYGPEPAEVLDPDPGGFPPGRLPGEEGACRCWCFTIEPPIECPPIEGDWVYFYDWDCDSLDIENTIIQFFGDGTFMDGNGRGGTWTQDNCDVDWLFDNGDHYWGVELSDGTYMEGEMTGGGGDGCWWAYRE